MVMWEYNHNCLVVYVLKFYDTFDYGVSYYYIMLCCHGDCSMNIRMIIILTSQEMLLRPLAVTVVVYSV